MQHFLVQSIKETIYINLGVEIREYTTVETIYTNLDCFLKTRSFVFPQAFDKLCLRILYLLNISILLQKKKTEQI
jgi:hypothetical protein